ncbi:hypothetical protein A2Z67_05920 [Candidatus Woesebacteria bacterium RBG_13_36_22]|uniref:Uncharacterized protein n=1 Tax=Candidatus Woesebacteria bacterium RBG_13_36_22 TaxID=1802478 RepID=A0A1F7X224_9BACT|nr:MAG: hypothetical protein A2Z67_05920 [Candidatus Woesebacteria bacterium RBG_13_36_22]
MALHNDVFQQQIWDFFCGDLESCLIVSRIKQSNPNSPFKGGLNFTATLVIFSVIELASGWWKGTKATNDIIASFIQKYFSKHDKRFKDKSFAKKFYDVFRNGLSHQWSPKASGIAMDFNRNWLLEKANTGGQEEILFLNVPTFYYLTKQALEDFEKELNTNESVRKMFEKRYKKIIESDYKEMRILRNFLGKAIKKNSS